MIDIKIFHLTVVLNEMIEFCFLVESVNFEAPLVTELNAEPPPARYPGSNEQWSSNMEVIFFIN